MAGQFSYGERRERGEFRGRMAAFRESRRRAGYDSGGAGVATRARAGPTFRGLRMSHDDQLALSDRVAVRYGGELLVASLMNRTTTAVRPRGEVDVKLGRGGRLRRLLQRGPGEATTPERPPAMDSALNALDAFPTVLLRHGRPVTEDDVHEEIAIEHAWERNGHLSAAVFPRWFESHRRDRAGRSGRRSRFSAGLFLAGICLRRRDFEFLGVRVAYTREAFAIH